MALIGLQLRIINGVVSLLTIEVHNKAMAAYLSEQSGASGNFFQMTTAKCWRASLLGSRAAKRKFDQLFDADKRGLVVKLRDLNLLEEFAAGDGRLRFATTRTFLQRFGLARLQELTAASARAMCITR